MNLILISCYLDRCPDSVSHPGLRLEKLPSLCVINLSPDRRSVLLFIGLCNLLNNTFYFVGFGTTRRLLHHFSVLFSDFCRTWVAPFGLFD